MEQSVSCSSARLETRSPEANGQPGWAESGQGSGARAAERHLGTAGRQILSCFGLELALRFVSASGGWRRGNTCVSGRDLLAITEGGAGTG